jgi:pimeloyl-ACP methyl ester carboxylesterase
MFVALRRARRDSGRGPSDSARARQRCPGLDDLERAKAASSRFTLVVLTRSGYPANPRREPIDLEAQALELRDLVEPGDHVVGHSYGGVVSLLAAPDAPLASLTVIEPPAFGVARGHATVEEFLSRFEAETPTDPRAYLEFFLPLVGSSLRLSDPLPPALEAGARAAMAERSPHEAVIDLDALAATGYPKLVVSGGHSAAFDAVCDVLEERLGGQRAVLPGAGHSIPRLGEPFNSLVKSFGIEGRNQTANPGSDPVTNRPQVRPTGPANSANLG